MDMGELMRLWRQDLMRTNYGAGPDRAPPKRVESNDFPQVSRFERESTASWQGRIARRLDAWGWRPKQIAPFFGCTPGMVYYLLKRPAEPLRER